jgi:hypothetical protein
MGQINRRQFFGSLALAAPLGGALAAAPLAESPADDWERVELCGFAVGPLELRIDPGPWQRLEGPAGTFPLLRLALDGEAWSAVWKGTVKFLGDPGVYRVIAIPKEPSDMPVMIRIHEFSEAVKHPWSPADDGYVPFEIVNW